VICRVCSNSENNKAYRIREMMFGFRDEFTYFECSECGCLQISDIPGNMEKYYPDNYLRSSQKNTSENCLERFLRTQSDRYVLFGTRFLGGLIRRHGEDPSNVLGMIARARPNHKSRILDVGCGSGEFLYRLRDAGIKNVLGVDPYIGHEVLHGDVKILERTIHDLPDSQKFELIILHHSFEHIPDQLQTLLKVTRVLAESGTCVIRMPLKTEFIWNLYGVHWVQIDAPRHLFIHTMKSFEHLATEAGLAIQDVVFDSGSFQFWGSEQVKRDIPLESENSYKRNPERSIFTDEQITEFEKLAEELNGTSQGDQATFYVVNPAK